RMYVLLGEARQRLDYLGERLGGAQQDQLDALRSRLEMAESRLSSVSPMNTLDRGYCIVRSSRGIVTGVGDVMPGDVLEIVLSDGTLRCRVLGDGEGIDVEGTNDDGINSEGMDNEKGEFGDGEG
ncbi:MAG TPA: exodeoxyribonuclease VII large subunit, partial [Methanotrichaceae archaeon]|nr:exodeoxyribonuclease VII large subunit [Methanotrichaceae archaeon]